MGMITSDFYSRFGKIDIVESPFTAEELMSLASIDTQEQFAAWTAENGDTSYIPAEIFLTLLEDRAFFEQICGFVDGGEYVVLSGATLACRTSHSSRMGLTREDVQQNIQGFFLKDEEMTYSIESVLTGTREWVSSLYVFANGWVGIETERFADNEWDEDEDSAQDSVPEPASSYLLDAEGELVASPDIRYDIEAWMDFVDMFSTVHEEAIATDTPDDAERRERRLHRVLRRGGGRHEGGQTCGRHRECGDFRRHDLSRDRRVRVPHEERRQRERSGTCLRLYFERTDPCGADR